MISWAKQIKVILWHLLHIKVQITSKKHNKPKKESLMSEKKFALCKQIYGKHSQPHQTFIVQSFRVFASRHQQKRLYLIQCRNILAKETLFALALNSNILNVSKMCFLFFLVNGKAKWDFFSCSNVLLFSC